MEENQTDDTNSSANENSTEFLAFLSKQQATNHPRHLANVLSTNMSKQPQGSKMMNKMQDCTPSPPKNNEIMVNGKKYHQVNNHKVCYYVSAHQSRYIGLLVDHGANGGIAGNDVRIIKKSNQTVDVHGIDNHQIVDIPIVTAGGVVTTQHGLAIAIFHQYAYTGQGKTIHSSAQLEWYLNDVNNKSMKVKGGQQHILTNDRYAIPISI